VAGRTRRVRWHASHLPSPAAFYQTHIIYDGMTTNETRHDQSSIPVILLASTYGDARNKRIHTNQCFTFKRLADILAAADGKCAAGPRPPPPPPCCVYRWAEPHRVRFTRASTTASAAPATPGAQALPHRRLDDRGASITRIDTMLIRCTRTPPGWYPEKRIPCVCALLKLR